MVRESIHTNPKGGLLEFSKGRGVSKDKNCKGKYFQRVGRGGNSNQKPSVGRALKFSGTTQ